MKLVPFAISPHDGSTQPLQEEPSWASLDSGKEIGYLGISKRVEAPFALLVSFRVLGS